VLRWQRARVPLHVNHVRTGYRVLAVDMPGHGRSQHTPAFSGNYSAETYLRICAALLSDSRSCILHMLFCELKHFPNQPFWQALLSFPRNFCLSGTGQTARKHASTRARTCTSLQVLFQRDEGRAWGCTAVVVMHKKFLEEQQACMLTLFRSMGAGIAQMLTAVTLSPSLLTCLFSRFNLFCVDCGCRCCPVVWSG
jgi:hypothetical protein